MNLPARRPVLHHAIIAAAILLGSHAAFAENRMALVIGQSAYKAVVALPNPANDAKAMAGLLGDAGFEVTTAPDLSQNELRETVGDFAAKVAAKGADTVALVFYAGHGMQIDGENYLVPIDVDPKREADIPLQAVRLNDVLNTLTSVPTRMRIVLLDACRNNPFPELNKTAGQGLAIVDAKIGAAGTFLSYSTSPGAEAEDGNGADSPYTTALLAAAREPGLSIEDAFKRVRVSVNKATDGRQTPWESSSLTDDFRFFAGSAATATGEKANEKKPVKHRSEEEWKRDLKGKTVEAANELIVEDGTVEAYEAFVDLFGKSHFGLQAQIWLDRQRRMLAWNNAVIINTTAGYRAFLQQYPDSDLTITARKLEERMRNKPNLGSFAAIPAVQPTNASLTCPCNSPSPVSPIRKVDLPSKVDLPPKKRGDPVPPRRVAEDPPKRLRLPPPDDEPVYHRRPPPPDYEPSAAPLIGGIIGGAIGGGLMGGGGFGGGGGGRGGGMSGHPNSGGYSR
jgi:hypothetical protein